MSTQTAASIRRSIHALSAFKQSRRYPRELRAQVASYARAELAAGGSLRIVSEALDIAPQTLERFLSEHEEAAGFIPVSVVDFQASPQPVVVRCPGGIVVENLDIDGVAALIRALS